MNSKTFYSWGGRRTEASDSVAQIWQDQQLPPHHDRLMLPYGMGRSYGDSCLLSQGIMLETRGLSRIIDFDSEHGILRCEAGCNLAEILQFCVPRGWFPPVTPGTKFVTIGGCVANDVHGKNHHVAGSFGCFVEKLGLRRSDGIVLECSPELNADLFNATIGGLGLTGLILWVEFRLRKISSSNIQQKTTIFRGLDTFFELTKTQAKTEFTVAWLDASQSGTPRGVFIAGEHEAEGPLEVPSMAPRITVPIQCPDQVLGTWATRLMDSAYFNLNRLSAGEKTVPFDPFFYPLDAVGNWNRAYGRKGLAQYQFVVPKENGKAVLEEAFAKMHRSKQSSFLTVAKMFGEIRSPGLLSFPRPGITVCFDFPYLGRATDRLLDDLDQTVFASCGALYPAKDGRMTPHAFERSFPRLAEFQRWIDPAFSSDFAKRTRLTP